MTPFTSWRPATKVAAACAAGLLVTALLGWLTAYGVGLTGSSAPTTSTIAMPSAQPRVDAWEPAFGQTLDLSETRAGRATRPSAPASTPPAHPSPQTTAASTPAPRPTAAPRSEPTAAPVRIVQQGDRCATEGAVAQTRSGATMVCASTHGNGRMRWRRG
jgi:hypothetical protein